MRREEAVGQHLLALDIGLPMERLRPLVRAVLDGRRPARPPTACGWTARG